MPDRISSGWIGKKLYLTWHLDSDCTISATDGAGGVFIQASLSHRLAKALLATMDFERPMIEASEEDQQEAGNA